ncbi:hypothetical protein ACIA6D_45495 [Streptomyces cacaoi]
MASAAHSSSSCVGEKNRCSPAGHTKASPFATLLIGNRLLSLPGSGKEVLQFAFDTRDGELSYDAGDALGVWPANGAPLVAEWLALTGLDPDELVDLGDGASLSLEEALRTRLDIARINTDLLKFAADRTGSQELKRLLRADNKDALAKWSWGRQAADVVAAFPVRASAAEWTGILKRLQPRLYSISSSPLAHPSALAVVRLPLGQTRPKRRHRADPAARLDLGFLVHADHDRLLRRSKIQPDDVTDLRLQLGISGKLERLDPVRLQAPLAPDLGHRAERQPQLRAQQPRRPVRHPRRADGRPFSAGVATSTATSSTPSAWPAP